MEGWGGWGVAQMGWAEESAQLEEAATPIRVRGDHRAGLGPRARRGGQQQAEGWATKWDTRVRALLHLGANLEPWPARQGKLQRTMLLLKAGGEL